MENRIIKFRAWDKKMSTMHDLVGFLIFKEFTEIHFGTSGFKKLRPDEVELLAFTGLKDKNGKEIYEGDICITGFYNHEMPTTYMNQEVSFEKGTFTVKSGAVEFEESRRNVPIQWVDEIEVIGNIFENKDLL